MSIYAKVFLAIYLAFVKYSYIIWGSTKPVVFLADNKSVTRFSQTKIIPPALWNTCDFVLQINLTIGHVPGRVNKAEDLPSSLDFDPYEKAHSLVRIYILTTPIVDHIQSSDVTEEEQFYFLPGDKIKSEEQIWKPKRRSCKKILGRETTSDIGVVILQPSVIRHTVSGQTGRQTSQRH